MHEQAQVPEQRIDKWLWHARIARTRTLAAKLAAGGRIRLNKNRVTKPSQTVRIGDVIAVPQGRLIRVLKVSGFSQRRGPPVVAQTLYEDLAPIVTPALAETDGSGDKAAGRSDGERPRGAGRPTKRERRAISKFKQV